MLGWGFVDIKEHWCRVLEERDPLSCSGTAFGKPTQCPVVPASFFVELTEQLSQRKRERRVLMFMRILYFHSHFHVSFTLPPAFPSLIYPVFLEF